MTQPLVTCLCLTRNRPGFLRAAVECFLAQTYANRELLIVGDFPSDMEGVDVADSRIRLEFALPPRPLVVGEKRNLGCRLAKGEFIAHWDDDDYSAPQRLANQVARLAQTGASVTGYQSMKFTDGCEWWQYSGPPKTALGTSLLYRRDWWMRHPFHVKMAGQDEEFAAMAAAKERLFVVGDLDEMYATIHPGNTAPRQLAANCYAKIPGYEWKDAA